MVALNVNFKMLKTTKSDLVTEEDEMVKKYLASRRVLRTAGPDKALKKTKKC